MRFRYRAFNQKYNEIYINGAPVNDVERGQFSFSSVGGLNQVTRNVDFSLPFEAQLWYDRLAGVITTISVVEVWLLDIVSAWQQPIVTTHFEACIPIIAVSMQKDGPLVVTSLIAGQIVVT